MNKIFKVVWSKVRNAYVVVSEIAKNTVSGVGKRNRVKRFSMGATLAAVALTSSFFLPSVGLAADSIGYANESNYIAIMANPSDDQKEQVENGSTVRRGASGVNRTYLLRKIEIGNATQWYWVQEGYTIHPKAVSPVVDEQWNNTTMLISKVTGKPTSSSFDPIATIQVHEDSTNVNTVINDNLDKVTINPFGAVTNSTAVGVEDGFFYVLNRGTDEQILIKGDGGYYNKNGQYITQGIKKFKDYFKTVGTNSNGLVYDELSDSYVYNGEHVHNNSVYYIKVDGTYKAGVFVVDGKVYDGTVNGNNGEKLLTGQVEKTVNGVATTELITYWGAEIENFHLTIAESGMTIGNLKEGFNILLENDNELADADIKSISLSSTTANVARIDLNYKAEGKTVTGGLNIVAGGGRQDINNNYVDTYVDISNVDAEGNNHTVRLNTGSVVKGNPDEVVAGASYDLLEHISVNGKIYKVTGGTINSGGTNLHIVDQGVENKGVYHGWKLGENTTENGHRHFVDTTLDKKLVSGNGTEANSIKYTIKDTAGNSVTLDNIADAEYVNSQFETLDTQITNLNGSDIDRIAIDGTNNQIDLIRKDANGTNVPGSIKLSSGGGQKDSNNNYVDTFIEFSNLDNQGNTHSIKLDTGSKVVPTTVKNSDTLTALTINGKKYDIPSWSEISDGVVFQDYYLRNGEIGIKVNGDDKEGYVVDRNGIVTLKVQDKSDYIDVYIADVARFSDVGDVNDLVDIDQTVLSNTVTDHITNLYGKVNEVKVEAQDHTYVTGINDNIFVSDINNTRNYTVKLNDRIVLGNLDVDGSEVIIDGDTGYIYARKQTGEAGTNTGLIGEIVIAADRNEVLVGLAGDNQVIINGGDTAEVKGLNNLNLPWANLSEGETWTGAGRAATEEQLQIVDNKVEAIDFRITDSTNHKIGLVGKDNDGDSESLGDIAISTSVNSSTGEREIVFGDTTNGGFALTTGSVVNGTKDGQDRLTELIINNQNYVVDDYQIKAGTYTVSNGQVVLSMQNNGVDVTDTVTIDGLVTSANIGSANNLKVEAAEKGRWTITDTANNMTYSNTTLDSVSKTNDGDYGNKYTVSDSSGQNNVVIEDVAKASKLTEVASTVAGHTTSINSLETNVQKNTTDITNITNSVNAGWKIKAGLSDTGHAIVPNGEVELVSNNEDDLKIERTAGTGEVHFTVANMRVKEGSASYVTEETNTQKVGDGVIVLENYDGTSATISGLHDYYATGLSIDATNNALKLTLNNEVSYTVGLDALGTMNSWTANVGSTGISVNDADTINYVAGKNITLGAASNTDGGGNITVATQDTVDFQKVTVGAVTIEENTGNNSNSYVKVGNVIIDSKSGISAGNKAITNVAVGVNDTDAVNVSQLKSVESKLTANDKHIVAGNYTVEKDAVTLKVQQGVGTADVVIDNVASASNLAAVKGHTINKIAMTGGNGTGTINLMRENNSIVPGGLTFASGGGTEATGDTYVHISGKGNNGSVQDIILHTGTKVEANSKTADDSTMTQLTLLTVNGKDYFIPEMDVDKNGNAVFQDYHVTNGDDTLYTYKDSDNKFVEVKGYSVDNANGVVELHVHDRHQNDGKHEGIVRIGNLASKAIQEELQADSIKNISITSITNGGTIGLNRVGTSDTTNGTTEPVDGTITVTAIEGSSSTGDAQLQFSNTIDGKGKSFAVNVGSTVRAESVVVDSTTYLDEISVNGTPYKVFTPADIDKSFVAEVNNLNVELGTGVVKSVNGTGYAHGWQVTDSDQPGVVYKDTTLVAGNALKQTSSDGANTYEVKDTAGNVVTINDVASASAVNQRFDNIEGNITNIQGDISNLTTDVTNIRGDISNLTTDVTNIRGDISNLTTDVTNIRTDISNLTTDVSNIRTDISNLTTDVTNIRTDVNNLTTDVTNIRADISNLTTDVSNIRTDITNITGNQITSGSIANYQYDAQTGGSSSITLVTESNGVDDIVIAGFRDTTLVANGNNEGVVDADNTFGKTYTISDTNKNSVVLKDVASASKVSDLAGTVGAATKESLKESYEVTTYLKDKVEDGTVTEKGAESLVEADVKLDKAIKDNADLSIKNDLALQSMINNNAQYLDSRINQLGSKVNKVGAGAAALAALHPMDFDPDDKLSFAVGAGNYAGETATALGAFYRPNEKVMMNVAGTYGNGENIVNMGVSFALDRTNHVSNSRTAMAKEIVDLREQVATQGQQIAQLVALVQQLAGVQQPVVPAEQLFPDVPENHWAYEYVNTLVSKGIIEGYPDGTFGGDRTMTRYEFAAMLFRAMEQGVVLSEQIRQEFEKELGRVRVDRVKGADNDPNKIERVRVNKAADRDNYGSKIVQVKH